MENTTSILAKRETCIMGAATETPCHGAAVPLDGPQAHPLRLPRGHRAALYAEIDDLSMALDMLRSYLKGARKNEVMPLVTALERAEADFSERRAFLDGVTGDLEAAERRLYRR